MTPYLLLLCIAIGFSWNGCALTFRDRLAISKSQLVLASAAASICICAVGLAFVDRNAVLGLLVVVTGLAIAQTLARPLALQWSLLVSAMAFAVFVQGVVP